VVVNELFIINYYIQLVIVYSTKNFSDFLTQLGTKHILIFH